VFPVNAEPEAIHVECARALPVRHPQLREYSLAHVLTIGTRSA
jgi:hypothetical protein